MLGSLSATWILTGYDESSNATVSVSRAMVWSTWSSVGVGFVYLISLAVCANNIHSLVANPSRSFDRRCFGLKKSWFGCGVAFVSVIM